MMELKIEKMIYGGDGLARVADGALPRSKTVFLPYVLAGEVVSAEVVEEKASFTRARPQQIMEASSHRATPGCQYFLHCGGCHYQHAEYQHQLEIKREVLRETLARTGKITWQGEIKMHSAEPWHYRNRTRLHVRAQGGFAAGYHRPGSHLLLPVRECPISSPLINRGIAALWAAGEGSLAPAELREVEFFAGPDDAEMLMEFYLETPPDTAMREQLDTFFYALQQALPELRGATAFTVADFSGKRHAAWGEQHLEYQVSGRGYRVSAGAFFQVNRFLLAEAVEVMTAGRSGKLALDLYAGTGLFAAALAEKFAAVLAVESSSASVADLRVNAASCEVVSATTEQFLGRYNGAAPDHAIVDPPRSGLGEKTARMLARVSPQEISYLSCDPATLSRDLRVLIESGYKIRQVHMLDLFPQTFHIETAVHLSR